MNHTYCEDINECTAGTHTCDSVANCTNTIGYHECACSEGYNDTGDGRVGQCIGIAEDLLIVTKYLLTFLPCFVNLVALYTYTDTQLLIPIPTFNNLQT